MSKCISRYLNDLALRHKIDSDRHGVNISSSYCSDPTTMPILSCQGYPVIFQYDLEPATNRRKRLVNLANKTNMVHNFSQYVYLLVYLSISTCYGRLCAHNQKKQPYLCDTWYLLFWNEWIF